MSVLCPSCGAFNFSNQREEPTRCRSCSASLGAGTAITESPLPLSGFRTKTAPQISYSTNWLGALLGLLVAGGGLWLVLTSKSEPKTFLTATVQIKSAFHQGRTSGWTNHGAIKTQQVEGYNSYHASYNVNGANFPYELSSFEKSHSSSKPIIIYYDPENPRDYRSRPPMSSVSFPQIAGVAIVCLGLVGCLLSLGIGGPWLLIRNESTPPKENTLVELTPALEPTSRK